MGRSKQTEYLSRLTRLSRHGLGRPVAKPLSPLMSILLTRLIANRQAYVSTFCLIVPHFTHTPAPHFHNFVFTLTIPHAAFYPCPYLTRCRICNLSNGTSIRVQSVKYRHTSFFSHISMLDSGKVRVPIL